MVVKNERGERVLDTLIKNEGPKPNIGKQNSVMYELGQMKAPTLDRVRLYLMDLFKGRTVVGYHLLMKCDDLGIEVPENFHDAAKMFNESPISGQQWQMCKLCNVYLNINFKKPAPSYAVSLLYLVNNKLKGN